MSQLTTHKHLKMAQEGAYEQKSKIWKKQNFDIAWRILNAKVTKLQQQIFTLKPQLPFPYSNLQLQSQL